MLFMSDVDCEMVVSKMRPMIHKLTGICLIIGENLGKKLDQVISPSGYWTHTHMYTVGQEIGPLTNWAMHGGLTFVTHVCLLLIDYTKRDSVPSHWKGMYGLILNIFNSRTIKCIEVVWVSECRRRMWVLFSICSVGDLVTLNAQFCCAWIKSLSYHSLQ